MTGGSIDKTSAPMAFDFQPRTRLVFGVNASDRAGSLARDLGARKILLVTDPGLVAAGHAARVQRSLQEAGLVVRVFDAVHENPTTRDVARCVEVARDARIDTLVGLGGGSSLDTAKGSNFLLTNGGRMQDYWGVGKATKSMLPLIAIPTTAGTGSECQCAALITDEDTHQKMACLDPKAAARVAILDPSLTLSQPARVTACTGVDTLTHALETAVTTRRTSLSAIFSRESFRLVVAALPRVLSHPQDLEARGWMLLAAAFGGMAIENSMLGAAHSAANPLTSHFGVVHGQAVGLMLPAVMRFNALDPAARAAYAELAVAAQLADRDDRQAEAADKVIARVEDLLRLAGLGATLSELGVAEGSLPALAKEAATQWTARFNPRPVAESDFVALYRTTFNRE